MDGNDKATPTTRIATTHTADSTPPGPSIPSTPPAVAARAYILQLADLRERIQRHIAQARATAAISEALYKEALALLTEIRERFPLQEEAEGPHIPPDDTPPS